MLREREGECAALRGYERFLKTILTLFRYSWMGECVSGCLVFLVRVLVSALLVCKFVTWPLVFIA
jgi:hypothetical protein